MIPKLVLSDSFAFDGVSSIVPVGSRGTDSDYIKKIAGDEGIFHKELSELKPDADKTYVHLIALGDEETLGANRNGDAFAREDNIKKHHTFVDLGHVFRNHKSDDPEKAIGDVEASAHNGHMGRVELLVALKNKLAEKEVEALNGGKQLAFSMGSLQDYDVCSVCNHKAPTAAQHCDHVKNNLREVLDDGRMIYMKNPNPKFFDISVVHKPADRVAYMLKKVALAQNTVGGHELADAFGFSHWSHPKYATMKTLASILKRIPAFGKKVAAPRDLSQSTVDRIKRAAAGYGIQQVLAKLAEEKALLSPKDFADVVVGHPCGCGFEEDGELEDVMDDHTQIDAFEQPAIKEVMGDLMSKEDLENTGMDPANATQRSVEITVVKKASTKAVLDPHELAALQFMYKQYKVAFATYHRDNRAVLAAVAATF